MIGRANAKSHHAIKCFQSQIGLVLLSANLHVETKVLLCVGSTEEE